MVFRRGGEVAEPQFRILNYSINRVKRAINANKDKHDITKLYSNETIRQLADSFIAT